MTDQTGIQDAEVIRGILEEINTAWTAGRAADLAPYFHPDIVLVAPGFAQRTAGRDACIQSFADFSQNATVQDFTTADFFIDHWGDTAVATYRYDITYTMKDTQFHDTGTDLYVFQRNGGGWQAVWRTMTDVQSETVGPAAEG